MMCKQDVKLLSVMMMDTFIERFGLTTVAAAKEAGLIFGLNEKTVRTWQKDFYRVFLLNLGKESINGHLF